MHPTQEPVAGADVQEPMPTEGLDAAVGERVRLALWRARITQQQLAVALDLDQAAVSRRLRGQTPWKVTDVAAAAELLGIPLADLMAPAAAAS